MRSKRKLRILFVSHSAGLYGAERSLLSLVTGLRDTDDADIAVLLPEHGPLQRELQSRGITIHMIQYYHWISYKRGLRSLPGLVRKTAINLWSALAARRWAKAWNPDLIYTNSLACPMGLILAASLQRPHIWHARELVTEGLAAYYDLGEWITMALLRNGSNQVICNSEALAGKLARRVPRSKLIVVHNGIDFSGLTCPVAAEKYEKTIANTSTVRLAIIGSVHPAKGQEDGIRAIPVLLAAGFSVNLVIIGGGFPDYLDRLKVMANELSVADHVSFKGYAANVPRELDSAAITLITSRFEAFGRIAIESLAHGTPVVAAATGGLPEVISERNTGLLYKPGDYLELAARVAELIKDRVLYETLVTNGWNDVTQRFTEDRYVNGARRVIHAVIGETTTVETASQITETK